MTISVRDDEQLASVLRAIPGVGRLYSAHPIVVAVASSIVTASGRPAPAGPLVVSDTAVKVRIGVDGSRPLSAVGADVHAAIEAYFREVAPGIAPAIEIEIATIR